MVDLFRLFQTTSLIGLLTYHSQGTLKLKAPGNIYVQRKFEQLLKGKWRSVFTYKNRSTARMPTAVDSAVSTLALSPTYEYCHALS